MSMREDLPFEYLRVATYPATVGGSRAAAALQRSLMPPPLHLDGFVQAAATTRPCQGIGGDFYDYLDTPGEFRVLLGDVCGKGTPAALQAALVQGILAGDDEAKGGPAEVVAYLNRDLCRRRIAQRFVTLFYGVITRDHRFTYCNAGHCRPMLVDHSSVRRLGVGGVPPGLFADAAYEDESLKIETGDTLVVFSDGISEAARQDQQFGDARILEIVTEHREMSAVAIVDRLMKAVGDFAGAGRQRDDMTVLVVRYLA
jgi:sigma-B regulation protein RsbU (phosphoserine phosphatase)